MVRCVHGTAGQFRSVRGPRLQHGRAVQRQTVRQGASQDPFLRWCRHYRRQSENRRLKYHGHRATQVLQPRGQGEPPRPRRRRRAIGQRKTTNRAQPQRGTGQHRRIDDASLAYTDDVVELRHVAALQRRAQHPHRLRRRGQSAAPGWRSRDR